MAGDRKKQYIAIDLKSFYASVEASERGLDPLNVNLVVADESRTDKTICLAVSPSLKAYGIPGRARLFEVKQKLREINAERRMKAPGRKFTGKSVFASELAADPSLELDMVIAVPRMQHYMNYSQGIIEIYLRYVAAEDLLVYSIDEVFIDATNYLGPLGMSAHELAMTMIRAIMKESHITATAGIGTNMFLAKVAMDIEAKHIHADEDGVRIAELDEQSYREKLWCHKPLTDFWRIGGGTARKLESRGIHTMGDIARCSVGAENSMFNEDLLYRIFGVNAELLIDHAWGWEPTEIADCRSYVPQSQSLSQGQVLAEPYTAADGRIVVQEMADMLAMDLVRKGLLTGQIVLTVIYDRENLSDPRIAQGYAGEVVRDWYGREVPREAHGSFNFERSTSSASRIVKAAGELYDRIVDANLLVRRFYIAAEAVVSEAEAAGGKGQEVQLDLFTDYETLEKRQAEEDAELEKEHRMQQTLLDIRSRFGKNSIVKGMSLQEAGTAMERNEQIGGHRA